MSAMIDRIRQDMQNARKERKMAIVSILSVLLGEIQNVQNCRSQKGEITDRQIGEIVKKIIASNNETLQRLEPSSERVNRLNLENMVLVEYQPQVWSQAQIHEFLSRQVKLLLASRTEGQAIGIAMKLLNSSQCPVDGKDVVAVVKTLRNY